MSKMSQLAVETVENDLIESKASIKDAYEFLEKLEAQSWCKKTQEEIRAYLRMVGHWPTQEDLVQEPKL